MVHYNCEDREVEILLRRMEQLLEKSGGGCHESVCIVEKGGELSVESSLSKEDSSPLISVPTSIMHPVDYHCFKLSGDNLSLSSFASEPSKKQLEMLELIVELYNRTDKIRSYQSSSPLLALKKVPALLGELEQGRGAEYFSEFGKGTEGHLLSRDELLLKNFLTSRVYPIEFDQKYSSAVIPFVDLMNHHPTSPPYNRKIREKRAFYAVNNFKPLSPFKECYTSYGALDAYDLFIKFGYVEMNGSFTYSIPLTIKLDVDGLKAIHVQGSVRQPYQGKLPPQLSRLQFFMPRILEESEDSLKVSHLMIPTPMWPKSLQMVLTQLIALLCPMIPQKRMQEQVRSGEKQIISQNIRYYRSLQKRAKKSRKKEGDRSIDGIIELADSQLSILRGYKMMGEDQ